MPVLREGPTRLSVMCAMAKTRLNITEAPLGFDARELFMNMSAWWNPHRRQKYLLRDDVQRPMSADTMVWPSLFGDGLPDTDRERLGLEKLVVPAWRGPNQNLWDDLNRMRGAMGALANEPHCIIAVNWVSSDGFSKHSVTGAPYREKTVPDVLGSDWALLGFDVGDAGLTSGLSNCGYSDAERRALKRSWARRLNEYHLFGKLQRRLCVQRNHRQKGSRARTVLRLCH